MPTATGRQGPTAERLRLADEVAHLRERGLTCREAAARLGISRSYASELSRDPSGDLARARKDSYAQPCGECGAPTSGSEGRREEPLCQTCANIRNGAERMIWTRESCIEAIQWWTEKYGRPPALADFSPRHSEDIGDYHRADRAAQHIAAGEIPWFTNVVERFGTWNAGLVAAGFPPRAPFGGRANPQPSPPPRLARSVRARCYRRSP